jgi:hypothetical protein
MPEHWVQYDERKLHGINYGDKITNQNLNDHKCPKAGLSKLWSITHFYLTRKRDKYMFFFFKLTKNLFHSMKLYIFWKLCNFSTVSTWKQVWRLVHLTPSQATAFLQSFFSCKHEVLRAEHWTAQALSYTKTLARCRQYMSLLVALNSWQQYKFVQSNNRRKKNYVTYCRITEQHSFSVWAGNDSLTKELLSFILCICL